MYKTNFDFAEHFTFRFDNKRPFLKGPLQDYLLFMAMVPYFHTLTINAVRKHSGYRKL